MSIAELYGRLVKEPFNWSLDLIRATTLRWKLEVVEAAAAEEKKKTGPRTGDDVYREMLQHGAAFHAVTDDPEEQLKQMEKIERLAQQAKDSFERTELEREAAEKKAAQQNGRRRR